MSTAPSEAHRSLVAMTLRTFELLGIESAAQLLADSEARAVEAALTDRASGCGVCRGELGMVCVHLSSVKTKGDALTEKAKALQVQSTEASLAAERERVRVLEEALAFITKHGGMTIETECGEIQCSGFWCAEQARAALAATSEHAKEVSV